MPAALAAGAAAQGRVVGDRHDVTAFFQTVRAAMLHCLKVRLTAGPVVPGSRHLVEYLSFDIAHAPVERFRILFLNARNRLLDEMSFDGTVSEAPVYPREIIRRALEVGATALILAHNHPSGDPAPSPSDIRATRRIAAAGRELGIVVHDHLIIAGDGWSSLKALGLLAPQAVA